MTMFVNLNIVSARDSHNSTIGRAFGHRLDHGCGHDVEQDLIPRLRVRRELRRAPGRWEHESHAWLQDVHGREPDEQGDRGDGLEVDDRPQTHASNRLDVARSGDARDERRKDERRDDHLDQPKEELAERVEEGCPGRMVPADERADGNADREAEHDLLRQRQARPARGVARIAYHRAILSEVPVRFRTTCAYN
jgi:hypothetical protein